MYKFLINVELQPGTRDRLLEAAPEAQVATRAEPGCIAYDFFSCTDDPDRMVFVEIFETPEAHAWHCEQPHTRKFMGLQQEIGAKLTMETINIAD